MLCAHVVNLAHGAESILDPQINPISRWTSLDAKLGLWYRNRSQEFKPMVDLESNDDLFPTILFTNSAGLLGNQMYHTAMLLLLQSKPRTVKPAGGRKSWPMSPLRHAHRICGIAMGNNCRESWDPSLLASFVVASKGMTHETQHEAILTRLDKISQLTGWSASVTRYQLLLREAWGI